jgi:hypothetical protein
MPHGQADRGLFPPVERAKVVAIACELPSQRDLPLGRHFASSVWEVLHTEGSTMSLRTVQRILAENSLKPWQYHSWIHPRDPDFQTKAEVILGLYEGVWQGLPLAARDIVICADEKPSIQARQRRVVAPKPGQPGLLESDYRRAGVVQYLAAWDVRAGLPIGRCEPKVGISAFDRLVDQVMTQEPYRAAPRIFWIVDNGSSHRGDKARQRLQERYPTLTLVHTPVHASWLNQVEIFFSLVQRKVLSPAAAPSVIELTKRILGFEARCRQHPKPFNWKFTRADFLGKLKQLAA